MMVIGFIAVSVISFGIGLLVGVVIGGIAVADYLLPVSDPNAPWGEQ